MLMKQEKKKRILHPKQIFKNNFFLKIWYISEISLNLMKKKTVEHKND